MREKEVLVIIPAYNESGNIEKTIKMIEEHTGKTGNIRDCRYSCYE